MKQKYDLGIVIIVKNEEPYIEEWVVYHKLIGFDHIYIFDNGSEDDTKKILQRYVEEGFVTLIDFPGFKKQIPAYNYALRKYRRECKFLAFIDTDEFVFVRNGNIKSTINEVLHKNKHAAGLAINWRVFGSSGHETKPEGLVTENYLYRGAYGKPGNDCVKTIVNPRKVLMFHNPHYPIYLPYWYSVDENGNKVKKWQNDVEETKLIQINHYFTKSKEEWIKRRSVARADTGEKRALDEFYEHDNNDIYDPGMLAYSKQIKQEMQLME